MSSKWAYKGEIQYNFAFCVGQSCDGAAAMASERSGVTSIVQNESTFAYYFYCATHCQNLSASVAAKSFSNTKCQKRCTKSG